MYKVMKILSNLEPERDPIRLPPEPTQNYDDNGSDNPNRSIIQEPQKPSTIADSFQIASNTRKTVSQGAKHQRASPSATHYLHPNPRSLIQSEGMETLIYTNVSCFNNGNHTARTGARSTSLADKGRMYAPRANQSNQAGEIIALTEALRRVSKGTPVCMHIHRLQVQQRHSHQEPQ
jgi:hypothetical protein